MLIFEMAKPSALTNLNLQIVFFAISTFDRVEEYHCGNCDSIVLFYDSSNLAQLNLVGLYIFLVKGIKNLIVSFKKVNIKVGFIYKSTISFLSTSSI